MIGNISVADTNTVNALLTLLADPAAAKAKLAEINAASKAAQDKLDAANSVVTQSESIKADAVKVRVEALLSLEEAQKLKQQADEDYAARTNALTQREVALAARENALNERQTKLQARENVLAAKEADITPLHDAAMQHEQDAQAALTAADRVRADVEGRLAKIKAAAA
jgi:chromosome segregation ATPase